MANTEADRLLQAGIEAARAGERAQARDLLLQVIALDEKRPAAWLWLSGVIDDPEERRICLENVLTLEPDNKNARAGLRWLDEQSAAPAPAPPPARLVRRQPPPAAPPVAQPVPVAQPTPPAVAPSPPAATLEIDPFGCPYCGGPVNPDRLRCLHCGSTVALRHRKRAGGSGLIWTVALFLVMGAVSWLEGVLVAEFLRIGSLPAYLSQVGARLMVGSALFLPDGVPGELVEFGGVVTLINYGLAGLCLLAAAGLAMRSRIAYFGSLLLAGLLVIAAGAGLLAGLTGWVPAFLRLALVALSVRWLVDCAPAFEWETREYNADVDADLRTDLDYYSRGTRYREMGMWAKAAAHWKVATQISAGKAPYHAALANAYLKMDYPQAALAAAERALACEPDDAELRAFRDALAREIADS